MIVDFVSFNIRCCDDPNGNSIDERAPRLKRILDSQDADVIVFQEVRPKWVPLIEENFSDEYASFLCYRSEEKPEGLVTLWKKDRFESLEKGYFWFSDTPDIESRGWDEKYNCPRICSYIVLKEKNSESSFLVMNTHFGFGDDGQVKSAKLIGSFRDRFSHLKAVVGGDFNMNPSCPAYRSMTERFIDANEVTVKDRRSTYHAYDPSIDRTSHIDYIFCDGITPQSFRIIDEAVDGMYPSDHFGICARLFL